MNQKQETNPSSLENTFKPSKFLTLRRIAHTKTHPNSGFIFFSYFFF